MKTRTIIAIALFTVAAAVVAQDTDDARAEAPAQEPADLGLSGYTGLYGNQDEVFHELGFSGTYALSPLSLTLDMAVLNSEKYVPAEEEIMFGYYFDFREGSVAIDTDRFDLTFGRYHHEDEVDSPYSVMISSAALPAVNADLSYNDGRFFYRSRWISLSQNSQHWQQRVPVYDNGDSLTAGEIGEDPAYYTDPELTPSGYFYEPLDRGANYKVFGMRFGDWRVAFQETVVYLNQTFYPEYFLSPLPMYFTQLVNSEGSKPWVQRDDENSLMGFMVDVDRGDRYGYAQLLLDDVNFSALTVNGRSQPQKWAWSFGGWRETPRLGRIGLYHGGSTRYTFEATTANDENYSTKRYEFTYWPAVEFPYRDGTRMIDYRDNYLGYLYGENNLALMATWEMDTGSTMYSASLETTVSGIKSPANPWGQYDENPGRRGVDTLWAFYIFEDGRVETTVRATAGVAHRRGPWEFVGDLMVGYRWNELELTEVEGAPEEPRYYAPSDTDRLLYQVYLGARYDLDLQLRRD